MAASILWKIGEKNEAHKLWQKSYNFDSNNRHTLLSLKILFNENVNYSYFFELFIKIKYNEYFSLKEEKGDKDALERYKDSLRKSKENYEKRIKEKDFSVKKKGEPPTLDSEAFDLLVEKNKLKEQVDLEVEKLKLKNRTTSQK